MAPHISGFIGERGNYKPRDETRWSRYHGSEGGPKYYILGRRWLHE